MYNIRVRVTIQYGLCVAVQIYVNLYLNILLATAKRVSYLFTKRVEILKT
jgi:hypothetical protein